MPRAVWLLVIGMAVNVTGSSFLWPLNSIYIHDHLGQSLTVAGFVLMLNAAATVIGNLLGGVLFDKLGGYKSICLGAGISALSLMGMVFWNEWPYYVVFLATSGFGSGIVFPSMYAMAGSVWKDGGRRTFNAIYLAQNIGVAIGAALGGFVASYSFQFIFMANLLMYIAFFIIVVFGYRGMQVIDETKVSLPRKRQKLGSDTKLQSLLMVCIGYLLCCIGYTQWQATISTYTQELNISLKQYSLLWTINGALIVIGQPLINRVLHYFSKIKSQMIVGMIIFIISFAVAAMAKDFSSFALAMVILTLGEMLVWPAIPTIADQLAPEGKSGFYQGIVNSTNTGGRMIGPVIGGFLVDHYGMSMLFILIIFLLIIALGTTSIYDRKLKAESGHVVS